MDIDSFISSLMDGEHTVRDILEELVKKGMSIEEAKSELHNFNQRHPQADNDEHIRLSCYDKTEKK